MHKIAKIEHNRASSTLLNTLGDINYRDVHNQVILALGQVRPVHKQTIPTLLEKSSDLTFRDDVIKSLLLLGTEATSAVITLLKSDDEPTRNNASYVLSLLGESAAIEVLKLLQERDPNVRHLAITLIGDIAADSDSAEIYLSDLIAVYGLEFADINQANDEFQRLADAFFKIGDPAIPPLTKALEDKKLQVRIGSALGYHSSYIN